MPKRVKKVWMPTTPKKPKPKVPDGEKKIIEERCNQLIEQELKPNFIKPPTSERKFNYLVDIFGKWYRHYFYFCSTYNCPRPQAISTSFESRLARLEYVKEDCFNLSYLRHTGQWWEISTGLSLEQCFAEIRTNPLLQPI